MRRLALTLLTGLSLLGLQTLPAPAQPATAQPASASTAADSATRVAGPAASGTLLRAAGASLYPRAIRLQHSGTANGRIIASVVTFGAGASGLGAIYESTNDGTSFAAVGVVADPEASNNQGLCCATLFELPRQIGAMPAGTLLWAGSVGSNDRPMALRIWRSNDLGRTWSYLSNCATAPNTSGLWEPEFSVATDGRLVCHYADETDPNHSQKLMQVRSSDGITWTDRVPTVQSPTRGHRPGMPVVRQLNPNFYVMVYEICALAGQYNCVVHKRTSSDGWNWGSPSDMGTRPQTVDGKYFTHTPTITVAGGKLLLIGQILHNGNGSVAADNGRTMLATTEGTFGYWYELDSPVHVPNPYDNFCPNYSSPLVGSADGTRVLQLASDFSNGDCQTFFATGSAVGTGTDSGVVGGATYRLISAQSAQCMDVAADSREYGGRIQQWYCNGLGPQNFHFTAYGDGYYSLKGQNSQLCVEVTKNSFEPGAKIQQFACQNGGWQRWRFVNIGRNYYKIVGQNSRHCLDVAGGSTAAGADLQIWHCNNLQPQIWKLERR
ncbi:RICIN domain-containing protein [Kribbella deserti]|uniref:RICIN domain-containing protein n=1 Tax=Kribbella deserti TaxID=1926257 RepID=A0ABV6QXX3_9ACTN